MNRGWFHFWRKLKDDPLWEPKRQRTKFEAWIDLCARAKGDPGRELVGHSMIPLERGQLIFTYLGLSKDWKWDRKKVRAFIASLEDEGRVRVEPKAKDTPFFILTLCNYDEYNPLNLQKGHRRDTPKDEKKDTPPSTQSPLNTDGCEDRDLKKDTPQSGKKDTSNKKDLKDIYSVEVEEVFDAYSVITKIRSRSDSRKSKIKARLAEYGKNEVLKAIENYRLALDDPENHWTHRFPVEDFMTPKNIDRFLAMEPPVEEEWKELPDGAGFSPS